MKKKGITPVIALVMLMLITVGMVGIAYAWFSGLFTGQTSTAFSVIFSGGSKAMIRNDGTGQINKITATLDGQPVDIKIVPSVIEPGKAASIMLLADSLSLGRHDLVLCTSSMCNRPSITVSGAGTGRSCLEILNAGGSVGNGVYTIKPDGVSDVQVYCDMSANEGGWTLAAVCKASEASNCWTASAKGSATDPNSATSVKLSDANIRNVLNGGEKTTRTYWRQTYRYNVNNPVTAAIFNKITDPNAWSSASCGSNGKEFYSKYSYANSISADIIPISKTAYASSWGNPILSLSTGCSCAVNGWSNTQQDSCGFATWYASCESGPSMSHCCACITYLERADITLWAR